MHTFIRIAINNVFASNSISIELYACAAEYFMPRRVAAAMSGGLWLSLVQRVHANELHAFSTADKSHINLLKKY